MEHTASAAILVTIAKPLFSPTLTQSTALSSLYLPFERLQ